MNLDVTPHDLNVDCKGSVEQKRALIRRSFSEFQEELRSRAKKKGLTESQADDLVMDAYEAAQMKLKQDSWYCNLCGDSCCGTGIRHYLVTYVSYRARGFYGYRSTDVDMDDNDIAMYLAPVESVENILSNIEKDLAFQAERVLFNGLLFKSMATLTYEQREALKQQYLDSEEELLELAERLGKTVNTIYAIRNRAKKKLLKKFTTLLKEEGLEELWIERAYTK